MGYDNMLEQSKQKINEVSEKNNIETVAEWEVEAAFRYLVKKQYFEQEVRTFNALKAVAKDWLDWKNAEDKGKDSVGFNPGTAYKLWVDLFGKDERFLRALEFEIIFEGMKTLFKELSKKP